jgi:hydroxyacylglutathione hydrolase
MILLNVKQFRYGSDNLGYLVYGRKDSMVIDGGAYKEILGFIQQNKLNLCFMANTHSHYDHTSGNIHFLGHFDTEILKYGDLVKDKEIELEGHKIILYNTPGHTHDSVCFHVGNILITGDTIFNGTIGNCFTGDMKGFYQSVRKIMTFDEETIVYAGHDYVKDAMLFARNLEPNNENIDLFLNRYNSDHVFSTLKDEFLVNPYMRFNDERVIAILDSRGLPRESEWERWLSLMSIE